MAKNIGEYDEMRANLRLIELRDTKKTVTMGGNVVGVLCVKNYKGEEFEPLPEGTDLAKLSDLEVESLAI